MRRIIIIIPLLILTGVFFMLTTCSLFVRPPAGPILGELPARAVNSYQWTDDLDFRDIERAVAQSIKYYNKLPPYTRFQYGGLSYSSREMAASLGLFIEIIQKYRGRERQRQLRKSFLFFESRNSEGGAFFTGYYEPVLDGSLVPTEEFPEPLYKTPDDLVEVDLGLFSDRWKDEKIVGRLLDKRLVPYDSREEIVYQQSLTGRAEPIAYVNEIELFFLQIQGSGIIRLPDGRLKRVNYARKNGHAYSSIGKYLRDKIPEDKMSLQSIKEYLYAHPDEVRTILSYNQSYVFFREIEEGPFGNIEVPLTPDRSIAMDRRVVPRGGLAYIETELPLFKDGQITGWKPVKRFVLVQDTGGAIRDQGRVDIFFGNGEKAELTAGHLKRRGRVFLIVARREALP